MLGIIGTVPEEEFPFIHGKVVLKDDNIIINGLNIPVNRGTPALIAAAIKAQEYFNGPEIYAFLAGDIGKGDGSRRLYHFLSQHLSDFDFRVLTFHYLQPDIEWHNKVLSVIEQLKNRPVLIADAGFMYAAKMSGKAKHYDFFTPDVGELSFLADEIAPHPFYTRGFILHQNDNVPELIKRAYKFGNASNYLLVKGETDYVVDETHVFDTVNQPSFEAMEVIGGTGDTITGTLGVLCCADLKPYEAAVIAAKVNRWAAYYVNPHPATQVAELINKIPEALLKIMNEYQKMPIPNN